MKKSYKVILSLLLCVALIAGITGCGSKNFKTIKKYAAEKYDIPIGAKIEIKDAKGNLLDPKNDTVIWEQLDKTQTYQKFRVAFDKHFNSVVINQYGAGGKNGILYINPDGIREGNNFLANVLLNKVYRDKYVNDAEKITQVANMASQAYSDTDSLDEETKYAAALGAFFNLLNNREILGANESISRQQFMSMLTKANVCVQDINEAEYTERLGDTFPYNETAAWAVTNNLMWLTTNDRSLTSDNVVRGMTEIEAAYSFVQLYKMLGGTVEIPENYEMTGIVNSGNLINEIGGDVNVAAEGLSDTKARLYALVYSIVSKEGYTQEELYKAAAEAKILGITDTSFNPKGAMTKGKALVQLVRVYNILYNNVGQNCETEFGSMN